MKEISDIAATKKTELTYLDPRRADFFWCGATLRMTVRGEYSCLKTTVLRMFPLSVHDRYLSVRDGDSKELGILIDPGELDHNSRQAVDRELERRYLVPEVSSILSVKERFGTVEWSVRTDRGRRTFTTRNLRQTAVQLSDSRYILIDTDGSRYHIPSVTNLDNRSRSLLGAHL